MKKSDFFYDLPPELIAQHPIYPRDASRLMVVDRESGDISHDIFSSLPNLLKPNDCLILNDTRVLEARLYGRRVDTGAKVEFLLLKEIERDVWEVLCGPGKKAKVGNKFDFDGLMTGEIIDVIDGGNRIVKFAHESDFHDILHAIGIMPLPHYITEELEDKERYQTVYSKEEGSAAAPTAGLHFTPELLDKIKEGGVKIGYVTLHVGLGTFRPVKEEEITEHKMHSERYYLPQKTVDIINECRASGGRVISVGTTSCRTLESVAAKFNGELKACSGDTDIFIYPGYKFKAIDGLITNFHLPESTLIMLVSAFAGYDLTMKAYHEAIKEKYRFFSFGDAMLIV